MVAEDGATSTSRSPPSRCTSPTPSTKESAVGRLRPPSERFHTSFPAELLAHRLPPIASGSASNADLQVRRSTREAHMSRPLWKVVWTLSFVICAMLRVSAAGRPTDVRRALARRRQLRADDARHGGRWSPKNDQLVGRLHRRQTCGSARRSELLRDQRRRARASTGRAQPARARRPRASVRRLPAKTPNTRIGRGGRSSTMAAPSSGPRRCTTWTRRAISSSRSTVRRFEDLSIRRAGGGLRKEDGHAEVRRRRPRAVLARAGRLHRSARRGPKRSFRGATSARSRAATGCSGSS